MKYLMDFLGLIISLIIVLVILITVTDSRNKADAFDILTPDVEIDIQTQEDYQSIGNL